MRKGSALPKQDAEAERCDDPVEAWAGSSEWNCRWGRVREAGDREQSETHLLYGTGSGVDVNILKQGIVGGEVPYRDHPAALTPAKHSTLLVGWFNIAGDMALFAL
ncbi:hypothetical protein [Neorhodopirellula lusitana]|uniref:hypothetical protein n=1 Tax=Neorhodopirellula lusitana TaxID=445327 RepID=UPI00384F6184